MRRRKILKVFTLILLAFFAISLGIGHGKLSHITSLDDAVMRQLEQPPVKGKLNLLLLGVDEGGTRSDTIMLVNVDNVKNEIKLLSFPRDTKITLNNGRKMKLNAGMGMKNGEKFMVETIKTITKMPIHYYCKINFDGFKEIIDILGGVDYNVPFDMDYDDPAQDLHIHLKAGPQHLDGQAAHDFVRFRHNNKGAKVYAPGDYYKGDIGRISAQQDFLSELFRQKMQPQYFLKAPWLLDAASKHVQTNFTMGSAMKFISMLKSAETTDLKTYLLPGTDRYENGVSYYIYSPSETKKLVLEEFGYPEADAKKKEENRKKESDNSAPSPAATKTPVAEIN